MYRAVKRVLDILLAILSSPVVLPVVLLLALLIKLDSPGPVFFVQKRVGKGKRLFPIYKYRTMSTKAPKDTPTHLLDHPERYITRMGRFLRRTSLDELPQVWNILKGDMSFIGPRPALWNQDDLIELRDKYGANDVLPGLTGWAQINGRDDLPIEVKAQKDGEYVERMSFGFDAKIFFLTFARVVSHEGVHEGGE